MSATRWDENWSRGWPGHPHLGGLHGFTDAVVLTRHEPGEPPHCWMVALSCGTEVLRMVGALDKFKCHAVMDCFGNLVKVAA